MLCRKQPKLANLYNRRPSTAASCCVCGCVRVRVCLLLSRGQSGNRKSAPPVISQEETARTSVVQEVFISYCFLESPKSIVKSVCVFFFCFLNLFLKSPYQHGIDFRWNYSRW
uniref:(northern house mosquito) hypothetical protein n=1 Tax=Culex pipiens TaxID=7175 RepID=A0A8D8F3G3_CULPI